MDMYVNTPAWDWVILNQQEVEQLVPDFKKYKMDSMFFTTTTRDSYWISLFCFFYLLVLNIGGIAALKKKKKRLSSAVACALCILYQWHWTTKSANTIISSGIALPRLFPALSLAFLGHFFSFKYIYHKHSKEAQMVASANKFTRSPVGVTAVCDPKTFLRKKERNKKKHMNK